MKLGVKTYSDEKFLKYFQDKADFFEIQAIQGRDYSFLKKFSKPFVIHAAHFSQGSNPADKTMTKQNLKLLNLAKKLADKTNSKTIVFHAGKLKDKNCSIENSIDFINQNYDKRIHLENVTSIEKSVGTTSSEMKSILQKTKTKFCFDVNHAIANANFLNKKPVPFIKEFLKLNPTHFHVGGQKLNSKKDNHSSFKDSTLPLKKILSLYPKNATITLEVTTSIKDTEYDLDYIRKIINSL
jgi:deoxyribonuclease IV